MDVLKIEIFIIAVEIIFLAVWTGIDRPQLLWVVSEFDENVLLPVCQSENEYIFWGIFLGYKSLFLCAGIFLGFQTRHFQKEVNDR
ncbi:hypothetical protein M1146_05810 [Patescibacteria group bacterium]|nr:hypothetical protein [Patescibacteria group bacterium]